MRNLLSRRAPRLRHRFAQKHGEKGLASTIDHVHIHHWAPRSARAPVTSRRAFVESLKNIKSCSPAPRRMFQRANERHGFRRPNGRVPQRGLAWNSRGRSGGSTFHRSSISHHRLRDTHRMIHAVFQSTLSRRRSKFVDFSSWTDG